MTRHIGTFRAVNNPAPKAHPRTLSVHLTEIVGAAALLIGLTAWFLPF